MIVLKEAECWRPGGHGLSSRTLAPAGESPAAFCEAAPRVKPVATCRTFLLQLSARLEVLLSLLCALGGEARWPRRIGVVRRSGRRQLSDGLVLRP